MGLYKRDGVWWCDIGHRGKRVRRSTGTHVKADAQRFHEKLKSELWQQAHIQQRPLKSWMDAVMRWLEESKHKRTLDMDKMHLRWIDPYFRTALLHEINQDMIEAVAREKEATGVSPSTVNRMLEVVRAILRKAKQEWDWIDNAPTVRMRKVENRRIRWLTYAQADRLLRQLPPHLRDMAAFTLATGLRESNVTGLQWKDVDVVRRHALIHPDQSKTKKAIPVPLNDEAIAIMKKQLGKHTQYVFTFKGKPVSRCNNHAWRKALVRAEIDDFRWHDLRHTWASWHVQSGTSLQELQLLGGWSDFEMVLRYAHLSSEHLQRAAQRIYVTKTSQSPLELVRGVS